MSMAYTLDEWLDQRKISRSSWYQSLAGTPKAPRTYRVGRRLYISADADREWEQKMAEDAADQ